MINPASYGEQEFQITQVLQGFVFELSQLEALDGLHSGSWTFLIGSTSQRGSFFQGHVICLFTKGAGPELVSKLSRNYLTPADTSWRTFPPDPMFVFHNVELCTMCD